jgi:Ni/Fe-hydrogenase subunit HybB-like protein
MLYTTVLIVEFAEVVLERLRLVRLRRAMERVSVPLVIAGAVLSLLHQSSLGTLFVLAPAKMHPLWYSPILPVHFFISCLAAGLAMICIESLLSARLLGHAQRTALLAGLTRAMAAVLAVCFLCQAADLWARGAMPAALTPGTPAVLFWVQTLLLVAIPIAVVLICRPLSSSAVLAASASAVAGFVLHRFNVAVSAMQLAHPTGYVPSPWEFVISVSLVAGAVWAAGLAVRVLPLEG